MAKESTLILNLGTRILMKDIMDQYVRSIGDYKTYYASNMQAALRILAEQKIDILISEVEYEDGSIFRLLKNLDWTPETSDLYVVLAIEEKNKNLEALADELEVQATLVKPFAAADLKVLTEKHKDWKALPKQPWQLLMRSAKHALQERRYRDVDEAYLQAIKTAPENPAPRYRAGMYYLNQKMDYAIAETILKKTIELKPDHVKAISGLGSLFMKKKEYERAEEYFRKALNISPMNPDRLLELVRLQTDWSIDMCKAALRMDPGAVLARFALGKLHALNRDYPSAVRDLEAVVHQVPAERKQEVQTFIALARKLGGIAKD